VAYVVSRTSTRPQVDTAACSGVAASQQGLTPLCHFSACSGSSRNRTRFRAVQPVAARLKNTTFSGHQPCAVWSTEDLIASWSWSVMTGSWWGTRPARRGPAAPPRRRGQAEIRAGPFMQGFRCISGHRWGPAGGADGPSRVHCCVCGWPWCGAGTAHAHKTAGAAKSR